MGVGIIRSETTRILLITVLISGSDDFTDVKSVIGWLNYIIFNQTERPSIKCQNDNLASLAPTGASALQLDARLKGHESPSSSSTNQSSLTGME